MKAFSNIVAAATTVLAVTAMSSSINAATVFNDGVNVGSLIAQPGNPAPVSTTGPAGTVSWTQVGSVSGQYRSPFESTSNSNYVYSFVQAGSTATFNAIAGGADLLTLIWGSPDPIPASWNTITFWSGLDGTGSIVDTADASEIPNIPPFPSGLENVLVRILADAKFASFTIGASQNAFEFAGLASDCTSCAPGETPIPGAALLMGSVLAGGVGGMQIMRRRRKVAA